ncbi:MAG: PAS domain S-box protein [Pseudomonadota bacterium]
MTDKTGQDETGNSEGTLREAAQKKLAKSPNVPPELQKQTPERIIHELRVHQIELENQNEELKRVHLALEQSKGKYLNLYDFAPVGYFTLTHKGIIREVNLAGAALLGMPRPKLIMRGFGHFIGPESLAQWDQHILSVLGHEEKQNCDLTLRREDGSWFYARLNSNRMVMPDELQGAAGETHAIHMAVTDMTDWKQAEKELRESEERYRTIADFNYDWEYWVEAEGNFLYVSPSCERITGYSAEEFISDPDLMNRIIHPDDRNRMLDHYNNVRQAATQPVDAIDFRIIRSDGAIRWIAHVCQPVYGQEGQTLGRRGSNRDITDRKRAEEMEKRLFTAIEHAAEGIIITDATGIIEYINPAEETITGYSHDELIGQKPNIFKSDKHDDNFYKNLWETINAGNVWSGRFINKKKNGTEYHEDATISPVYDKSGNLTNFVAVKHDVTKQVELQNQFFQAQKMEAIGNLAGGFAHDFNNKLQVIAGYVELTLFNKDRPENYKHDMGIIKQAVDSSAELIKGMMMFSRKTATELQPVELNKLVEQTRSMLSRSIPKTIAIDLLLADDLWAIKAAPNQIDQILMNLAVNASDAMPDGGRLTIKTNNIVLDDEFCSAYPNTEPGRYALITVADTGAGMNKETESHIFEPFFTTKGPGKGTGLGLAVVYGIVEQHGARIICESKPSVGTTFRIYFPAIEEVAQEQLSKKTESPKGQGETILLVDDEPEILEMISLQLTGANYQVIPASNAKDALELYEKNRDAIRLVLLDLIMPEIGGKQCLEALRNMDPNIKVIIITGHNRRGMTQELKEAGARDFILKPFDMPQLLEKIREIIDAE